MLKEPPERLFGKVLTSIEKERKKRKIRQMVLSFLLLAGSLVFLGVEVENSDICYFVSVAGFDLDSLLAIAETLPVLGIVIFLASFGLWTKFSNGY